MRRGRANKPCPWQGCAWHAKDASTALVGYSFYEDEYEDGDLTWVESGAA